VSGKARRRRKEKKREVRGRREGGLRGVRKNKI
jgi:hypothetical protein